MTLKFCSLFLFCSLLFILPACGSSTDAAVEHSRVITPVEALDFMNSNTGYLLLDVREQYEFDESHIEGAICIPYTALEAQKDALPESLDVPILVYCRSGRRSAIAADTLVSMGYENVMDFGGIIDWPYEVVTETEAAGEAQETTADDPKTEEAAAAHEHVWEEYDCTYEVCTICGKFRHIN